MDLLLVGSQLEKVSIMVRKVDAITLSICLISVLLASTYRKMLEKCLVR